MKKRMLTRADRGALLRDRGNSNCSRNDQKRLQPFRNAAKQRTCGISNIGLHDVPDVTVKQSLLNGYLSSHEEVHEGSHSQDQSEREGNSQNPQFQLYQANTSPTDS